MSQKVEKVHQGGGGPEKNIKKSKNRNLDFLIRGGAGLHWGGQGSYGGWDPPTIGNPARYTCKKATAMVFI